MTRILIADDHEVVRFGLRAILEAHEGWEVVAEACDGKEAIAKAVETSPDVAIIDYSLPVMNGVEATRQIRARVPTAEVLIFTCTIAKCWSASCWRRERAPICSNRMPSNISSRPWNRWSVTSRFLPERSRNNCSNAPRGGDAQAQRHFDRCNRPLCHPQQAGGALKARRLRLPCGGTHSDTRGDLSVTGRPPLYGTTRLQ